MPKFRAAEPSCLRRAPPFRGGVSPDLPAAARRGLSLAVPAAVTIAGWLAVTVMLHEAWTGGAWASLGPVSRLIEPDERLRALVLSLCRSPGDASPWHAWGAGLAMWAAMVAAFMLPCATPGWRALLRRERATDGLTFLAGYCLLWIALGAVVVTVEAGLRALMPEAVTGIGAALAPAALAIAGLYQFTAAKAAALAATGFARPCTIGTGDGRGACLGDGLAYGRRCLASNGVLMALMPVLGMTAAAAMPALAVAMAIEKAVPGKTTARIVGLALLVLACGSWLAGPPR